MNPQGNFDYADNSSGADYYSEPITTDSPEGHEDIVYDYGDYTETVTAVDTHSDSNSESHNRRENRPKNSDCTDQRTVSNQNHNQNYNHHNDNLATRIHHTNNANFDMNSNNRNTRRSGNNQRSSVVFAPILPLPTFGIGFNLRFVVTNMPNSSVSGIPVTAVIQRQKAKKRRRNGNKRRPNNRRN